MNATTNQLTYGFYDLNGNGIRCGGNADLRCRQPADIGGGDWGRPRGIAVRSGQQTGTADAAGRLLRNAGVYVLRRAGGEARVFHVMGWHSSDELVVSGERDDAVVRRAES